MFLAQTYNYSYDVSAPTVSAGLAAGALFVFLIWMLFALVIALVGIVALWKIFVKAGQPGWAAIIPIYNVYNAQDYRATRLVDTFVLYTVCKLHNNNCYSTRFG